MMENMENDIINLARQTKKLAKISGLQSIIS